MTPSNPDEVIRSIVDTGGYIGICATPSFLGRSEDIAAMLDHVDYVVKCFGTGFSLAGNRQGVVSDTGRFRKRGRLHGADLQFAQQVSISMLGRDDRISEFLCHASPQPLQRSGILQ
jgi:hypothetical protein